MSSTPPVADPSTSEREKTRRTLIVASAITLVGLTATILFFRHADDRGGLLKVSQGGVEVRLDRPVGAPAGSSRQVVPFGDTVEMTTQHSADTASSVVLPSDRTDAWQVRSVGDDVRIVDTTGAQIHVRSIERAHVTPLIESFTDEARAVGAEPVRIDATDGGTTLLWFESRGQRRMLKVIDVQGTARAIDATAPASAVTDMPALVAGATVSSPSRR